MSQLSPIEKIRALSELVERGVLQVGMRDFTYSFHKLALSQAILSTMSVPPRSFTEFVTSASVRASAYYVLSPDARTLIAKLTPIFIRAFFKKIKFF